jgi:hypothetical protein
VVLAFSLQQAKVHRASLGDLLPTLPSKLDGGGILLFWQNSEDVALAPDRIMHHAQSGTNENAKQSVLFSSSPFPDRNCHL